MVKLSTLRAVRIKCKKALMHEGRLYSLLLQVGRQIVYRQLFTLGLAAYFTSSFGSSSIVIQVKPGEVEFGTDFPSDANSCSSLDGFWKLPSAGGTKACLAFLYCIYTLWGQAMLLTFGFSIHLCSDGLPGNCLIFFLWYFWIFTEHV